MSEVVVGFMNVRWSFWFLSETKTVQKLLFWEQNGFFKDIFFSDYF